MTLKHTTPKYTAAFACICYSPMQKLGNAREDRARGQRCMLCAAGDDEAGADVR